MNIFVNRKSYKQNIFVKTIYFGFQKWTFLKQQEQSNGFKEIKFGVWHMNIVRKFLVGECWV